MRGSVRKKGKTWSYRIDLGILDGKRKQKEKSGFKTEKEAQAALTAVLDQYNKTGEYVDDKKITFQQVYEEFITKEAPSTREYATIVKYKSLYKNHFHEPLACKYMFQITTDELQDLIFSKSGKLSVAFIRGIYNFLLVLFGYANRKKYIRKNPMEEVIPPKDPRNKDSTVVYTEEQLRVMDERFKSTNIYTAFKIGVNTGVRVGECFGLRWSDIDFVNNTIVISKQLQRQNKKWSFVPPKTESSYRTIKIGKGLKDYLLEVKAQQDGNRELLGDYYKSNIIVDARNKNNPTTLIVDDLINVKPDGSMLNTHSNKVLSRICREELNVEFKFHSLRHTHATMLAESGVNPKYVQQRLGHAKLEITLRYYTHITDEMHEKVANILDSRINF